METVLQSKIQKNSSKRRSGIFNYKVFLFFSDVLSVVIAFGIGAALFGLATINSLDSIQLFILFLTIISILCFFPYQGLYSHHEIYLFFAHFSRILTALFWVLLTLVLIATIYSFPGLFSGTNLYVLAFLAFFTGIIVSRILEEQLLNAIRSIGIAFVFVGVLGILYPSINPIQLLDWRILPVSYFLIILIVLGCRITMVQFIFNKLLKRYFRRQTLIFGTEKMARDITSFVIDKGAPYWIAGAIGESRINSTVSKECLGDLLQLPIVVENHQIEEIIVTESTIAKQPLISLLDFCISRNITVWFPPDMMPIVGAKLRLESFCGLPMIRLCSQKSIWLVSSVKYMFDKIAALILFLLLSPLFAVLAFLVKTTSKGPVLYGADAIGKEGQNFTMYKFRSMIVDADAAIHQEFVTKHIKGEVEGEEREEKPLKIVDDPRVTKVGKWLRKLSLDELPQLINVLKGDMSLVGPRPCLPYEYEIYLGWHKKRTAVRPGITGLWQVAGRSEVLFEDMILLDLYYIYNKNLSLDLNILYETFFVLLSRKGAY